MSIQIVAVQMSVIFLLMAIGFFLVKKGKLSESTTTELSSVVANICNPAILISSAIHKTGTISFHKLYIMAIVSIIGYIFLIILGRMMGWLLHAPKKDWTAYNIMTIFGNTAFIGIPLATATLGSDSLVYLTEFNIFYCIVMYTYGINVICKASKTASLEPVWKRLINTGSISSLLTILIFTLDFHIPAVLSETITYIGNATVFISIVIIGASLATMPLASIFSDFRLYIYTFIRILIVPIAIAFILRQFIDDPIIIGITVIVFAVPNGNLPMMICKEKGMETDLLARGIILTTVLSLITITITAMFV